MPQDVSLITLVSDHGLFRLCVETFREAAPDVNVEVIPIDANARGWDAAQGLNQGLRAASHTWAVLAHQDVLFPNGWWPRALTQIQSWKGTVGVAGTFGLTPLGRFRGHVLDPHGHRKSGPMPARVASLDEHLLIIDRRHGLKFDEAIPHFHCYGTDIVLNCLARGLDAIVVNAPVVHLSGGRLDDKFAQSSAVLAQKWASRGVLPTCATLIGTNTIRGRAMMPIYKAIRMHSRHTPSDARLAECLDDYRPLPVG